MPTPSQPNRILADKPPAIWVVIAQEIIVKASFLVEILVLQSERLMCVRVNLVLCGQFSPSIILPRPQQVAELVGLLPRNADLVDRVQAAF